LIQPLRQNLTQNIHGIWFQFLSNNKWHFPHQLQCATCCRHHDRISDSSARHQPKLQEHWYGISVSTVYLPAYMLVSNILLGKQLRAGSIVSG